MNPQNLIISGLNPRYFWDVDLSALKYASATRLIIERIFFLGDMKEMNQVINFYGEQKVIEALCNLAYIDPKTLNLISFVKTASIIFSSYMLVLVVMIIFIHWKY